MEWTLLVASDKGKTIECQTHPIQIAMDNFRFMKISEASCNVLQLRIRWLVTSSWSSEVQGSHQANPVCFRAFDVVNDVSVGNHLRDHRKLSDVRFDFDSNKPKNIGMGHVHPNNAFLAEGLDSVSLIVKDRTTGHLLPHLVEYISIVHRRRAKSLHSNIHSVQSTLSDVRKRATCDYSLLDLIPGEGANKVAFRDLA